jgi:hypothetical protein
MPQELNDQERFAEEQQLELELDNSFKMPEADASAPKTAADPQDNGQPVAPTADTPAEPVITQPKISPSLMEKAKAANLNLEGINNDAELAEAIYDAFVQTRAAYQASAQQPAAQPYEQQSARKADNVDHEHAKQFDLDGHFNGLWKVPQMDDASKHLINSGVVQIDPETGIYKAKPGFELMAGPLLNNLNQSHIAHKQQLNSLFEGNFFTNSWSAYQPAVEHLIAQKFQELAGGWQSQQQTQQTVQAQEQFVNKFEEDNAKWLFKTNILGEKSLSEQGQKFASTVAELREAGIQDPQRLAKMAMQIAGIQAGNAAAPAKAAASAPVVNDGRERDEHGRFIPKQESFIDKARRQAAENSNSRGYSGDSIAANEGDLDNLWQTEWRQRQAAAT